MPNPHPADDHISAARARLVHTAALTERTHKAEQRILALAEARHAAVLADLESVRARVHLDPAAADSYQALTTERGQLEMVIARARQALRPTSPDDGSFTPAGSSAQS